jgi:hypothetical protein
MITQYVKFTPVGEYIRILILRRLATGPTPVEEVDGLAKKAVETLGIRYDWRVWPRLVEREVEIRGNTATITTYGRWILEQTSEEVEKYIQKWLGVSL